MTLPLDPNDLPNGGSEFDYGPGMFPPGIADGEGQTRQQDDFGVNMIPMTNPIGDHSDNYARAVADRRTDPTDPDSQRDFECLGNPDRFGGAGPLIKATPERNVCQRAEPPLKKLVRKP
jgi:hypothetical protein